METGVEHAVWPDHAEDLSSIIFGQSALQFYKDSAVITTSGSDIDNINKLVANHPLNETKQSFDKEICEKLWKALVSTDAETSLVADVKLELLRQVKLYIEHGIDVLRSQPSTTTEDSAGASEVQQNFAKDGSAEASEQPSDNESDAPKHTTQPETAPEPETAPQTTPESQTAPKPVSTPVLESEPAQESEKVPRSPRRQKRARSRSITNEASSKKKQKVDQKQAEVSPDQIEMSNSEDEKKNEPVQTLPGPESASVDRAGPEAEAEPTNSPDAPHGQSDAPDKASQDQPSNLSKSRAESSPEPSIQSSRLSRRKLRASRSNRSTPEPEQTSDSRSKTPESEAKSAHVSQDQASSTQKANSDPENDRVSTKRPNKAREDSEEVEEPTIEAEPAAKRKRGVTFDEKEGNPLEKFVTELSKDRKLAAFEQTEQHLHPRIISPTSLGTIASEVRKKSLQNIESVELELFKMLANSVMIGDYSTEAVKELVESVDSAISRFRETTQAEDALSATSHTKRRRKD